MKIGEFSRLYNVSKDTLRYYVSIGLLSPKMQGSQMNFTEREERDFLYIQRLKEMRFNIKEIRSFMYMGRVSNMIEPSTLDQCRQLLEAKREELLLERQKIDGSLQMIEEEEETLEEKRRTPAKETGGVPLSAIQLLACPHCGEPLMIENASISHKYLNSGSLKCSCGYQARIKDGILKTDNIYTGEYDRPDLTRKLYHDTGEEWLKSSTKCNDFMLEEIKKRNPSGKVILEANVNGFFFTYNFLSQLPKNCLYIIVDKYEEVLSMYKNYIEILYQDLDILYIADASEHFPLRKDSVDLFLSLFGENEYSFYHKNCQLFALRSIIKPEGEVIGAFQSLPIHSVTRKNIFEKYPEGSLRRLNMNYLQEDYRKSGFSMEKAELGVVEKTIKHHMFTCHVDGEPITLYGFTASRTVTPEAECQINEKPLGLQPVFEEGGDR